MVLEGLFEGPSPRPWRKIARFLSNVVIKAHAKHALFGLFKPSFSWILAVDLAVSWPQANSSFLTFLGSILLASIQVTLQKIKYLDEDVHETCKITYLNPCLGWKQDKAEHAELGLVSGLHLAHSIQRPWSLALLTSLPVWRRSPSMTFFGALDLILRVGPIGFETGLTRSRLMPFFRMGPTCQSRLF